MNRQLIARIICEGETFENEFTLIQESISHLKKNDTGNQRPVSFFFFRHFDLNDK